MTTEIEEMLAVWHACADVMCRKLSSGATSLHSRGQSAQRRHVPSSKYRTMCYLVPRYIRLHLSPVAIYSFASVSIDFLFFYFSHHQRHVPGMIDIYILLASIETIKKLVSCGRLAGTLSGKGDGTKYTPLIVTRTQTKFVDDFFKQNNYMGMCILHHACILSVSMFY